MNAEIDIGNVILRTNRLILRSWTLNDLDDYYEYASVDGVGQPAGWLPIRDKETARAVLQRFVEEKKTFALEFDGKVIGSLGIEEYDERELSEFQNKRGREIGYVLSKKYWGNGLMPETVKAVSNTCSTTLVLIFLFADTMPTICDPGECRKNAVSSVINLLKRLRNMAWKRTVGLRYWNAEEE